MRILVTGASGFLGQFVAAVARDRGHYVIGIGGARAVSSSCHERHACDLATVESSTLLTKLSYGAVIHCAAKAGVPWCHHHRDEAWATNVDGTVRLACAAAQHDSHFVFVSSDVVFAGDDCPDRGYGPDSIPAPVNFYGETKVAGEAATKRHASSWTIVRPSLLFRCVGEGEIPAGAEWVCRKVQDGEAPHIYTDQIRHPSYGLDLARLLVAAAETRQSGIVHGGCRSGYTRYEFSCLLLAHFGLSTSSVQPTTVAAHPPHHGLAVPRNLSLNTETAEKLLGRPMASPAALLQGI